ncbi:MAG: hypothetical protein ACOC1P_04035, partial [Minisyncoccales bacterium]
MKKYVQAVKIKCEDPVSQARPDIGLYSSGSGYEFQWVEYDVDGLPETYTAGIIENISDITQKSSFKKGGNSTTFDGMTLSLYNHDQLSLKLAELMISLTGCKIEVWEFVGEESDADSQEA